MRNDVFVVVVSYNSFHNTRNCINSLLSQTEPCNILVWDNASTDGTAEWLSNQSSFNFFLSQENLFWTPAINSAIRGYWSGEEYVCFMNNDIILEPDALEKMKSSLKDKAVGLVAPVGCSLGGIQDYVSNLELYKENSDEIRVNYVVGAMCMLRKDVWDSVGTLDPMMPLGADDHDYSIRVKHEGYKILVRKDVYINHLGHATHSSPNWDTIGKRSWEYFEKKWAGYFCDLDEAITSHWNGIYHESHPRGTGWTEEQYQKVNEDLKNATKA